MSKKKGFKWRGVTTFILAFSTLFSTVSGIILYFTHSGRIARNTDWSILGMDKWGWKDLHIIFSTLLLIIILFHLYYNWRVIFHFFWSRLQSSVNLKKELIVSATVILAVFLGTIYSIEPFASIIDVNETFKHKRGQRSSGMGWGGFQNEHEMIGQEGRRFHGNSSQSGRQQGFGKGRGIYSRMDQERGYGKGRGRSFRQTEPVVHSNDTHLRGRDIVRIGKHAALSGILAEENNEWKLTTDRGLYEIHMGPSGYRESKGFQLKAGNTATASGFVYQNHIAVTQITSMDKTIVLRDNTGRPAWARSKYSRGTGRKN